MLADDMSSAVIQGTTSILTNMAAPLVKEIINAIFSLGAGTGRLIWDRFFEEAWKEHKDKVAFNKIGGEKSVQDFYRKYKDEPITFKNIEANIIVYEEKNGEMVVDEVATQRRLLSLENKCKQLGIPYAFMNGAKDENGFFKIPLRICILEKDKALLDFILDEIMKEAINEKVIEDEGYKSRTELEFDCRREAFEQAFDKGWNYGIEYAEVELKNPQELDVFLASCEENKEALKQKAWEKTLEEHPEFDESFESIFSEQWEETWKETFEVAWEYRKENPTHSIEEINAEKTRAKNREVEDFCAKHAPENVIDAFTEQNHEKFELAISESNEKLFEQKMELYLELKDSKVWEEAWENADFDGKLPLEQYAGATKKEKLMDALKEVYGEDLKSKCFILSDTQIDFQDKNNNTFFINAEKEVVVKLTPERMQEYLKNNYRIPEELLKPEDVSKNFSQMIEKANDKLKDFEYLKENKYKGYKKYEVEFFREVFKEQQQNPDIKLELLDKKDFSFTKRLFLREAMRAGMDARELSNYNGNQIKALVVFKRKEAELGFDISKDVKEAVLQRGLKPKEIEVLTNKVWENPNINRQELDSVLKNVRSNQKEFGYFIEYGGKMEIEMVPQKKDINIEKTLARMEKQTVLDVARTDTYKMLESQTEEERKRTYDKSEINHEDSDGRKWAYYESENNFDYYISDTGEIKAVQMIEDLEKTQVVKNALDNIPKDIDTKGEKWFSVKRERGMDVLVNEKGKAKVSVEMKHADKLVKEHTEKQKSMQKAATKATKRVSQDMNR